MARRKKIVVVEPEPVEETVVVETTSSTVDSPASVVVAVPDLKNQIRKLIDEAPLLVEVQGNAWKYTEWLARLNTLVLQ